MKAQSKKTFKFRKTRGRRGEAEEGAGEGVATIEGTIVEQSPPLPTATATTQTPTTPSAPAPPPQQQQKQPAPGASKLSGSLKPVSLTATVIRRAKQRQKRKSHGVEIVIDDDSISSTRTSSTVGYRDSFGENDDGCFHLLER